MNTKAIIGALAICLILGAVAHYRLSTSHVAPAILSQAMFNPLWDGPPPGLLDTAEVKTADGSSRTVDLMMAYPSGAMYREGAHLYAYSSDGYTFTYLPNSDADSFENFDLGYSVTHWAKDNNNVYCEGRIVTGADARTLHRVTGENADWLEDKNGTYGKDNECPAS